MKVVHVAYCFHPDPVGGTERYVVELVRELGRRQMHAIVAAPAAAAGRYDWDGISVFRFATTPQPVGLRDLHGAGDPIAAGEFGRLLDGIQPDLVHLHASSTAVSLRLLQEVGRRRIPVVFTHHTPAVTCARESLMRWGSTPCRGEMLVHTCAACALHGRGMNRLAAGVAGALPVGLGVLLAHTAGSGKLFTTLRMSELMKSRHQARRAFLAGVDHIVAVSEWGRQVLMLNGVPPAKITVCRQGLAGGTRNLGPARTGAETDVYIGAALRLAYLGRFDPLKGLEVLFQALQLVPTIPVTLTIFGVAQGEQGRRYAQILRRLAARDSRIAFEDSLPSSEVLAALRAHDMLVVPSQCLETGPLVVLEAFAAGRPVIGSRLGGISENVEDGVDGCLVAPGDVRAWAETLRRLSGDRGLVRRLAAGVRPPRSISEVADDTVAVYGRVLAGVGAGSGADGLAACR